MAEYADSTWAVRAGEPAVVVTDNVESIADQLAAADSSLLPAGAVEELVRTERLHAAHGLSVRYAVATDGRRVCGLLPIYPAVPPFPTYADPHALIGPREGGWTRGSYLGSLGRLPNVAAAAGPDRAETLHGLVTKALDVAAADGAEFACAPLLRDGLVEHVRRSFGPDLVVGRTTHEAVIDIAFSSFEGYVKSLPARQRQVRRERRRFAECGLTVDEVPLIDAVRDLAPLMRNVERKYGNDEPVEVSETYLVSIALAMGAQATTLVAHDGRSPVAFSVIWRPGPDWRVRSWGCDYARTGRTLAYFNLVYYEPIARAAASGARRLVLGTEALEAKLERGARLDRLTTVGLPLRGRTRPPVPRIGVLSAVRAPADDRCIVTTEMRRAPALDEQVPGGTLVGLDRGWQMWPLAALRTAGAAFDRIGALAAEAALEMSAGNARAQALRASWRDGVDGLLRDEFFLRALTWQNPDVVDNWLADYVAALFAGQRPELSRMERRLTMLAKYVQRYCAKNETIGFFGPVSWARWSAGPGTCLGGFGLRRCAVFFEVWAVQAVVSAWAADPNLRPWSDPSSVPAADTAGRTVCRDHR
jgi:Lantibiotic dehydratase, N terminus/Peptidogalycan biosysnthesis/recognition